MVEENENTHEKKEIKIVEGDPKDLDISSVKDNLSFEIDEKSNEKKKNIIIPESKK